MLDNKSDALPIMLIVVVVALTTILFVMWRDNELEEYVKQIEVSEAEQEAERVVQINSTISQQAPTDATMGTQPVGSTLLIGSQSAVFNALEIQKGVNSDQLSVSSSEELATIAGARVLDLAPGTSELALSDDEDTLCPVTRWGNRLVVDERTVCTRLTNDDGSTRLEIIARGSYFFQRAYCTEDLSDCDSFNLEEALLPERVQHDHSE